jgi:uncharacterized RDD family membrane protein YckC
MFRLPRLRRARTTPRCGRASAPADGVGGVCRDCLVRLGGVSTCAECKLERLSDLRSGEAELDYASPWARFGAAFIDFLIFFIPALPLFRAGLLYGSSSRADPVVRRGMALLGAHPQRGIWLPLFVTCLLTAAGVVYEAWMLSARGQTLGAMALGIKVVTPERRDIRVGQAWLRVLSEVVFGRLYLGVIDYFLIFTLRRRTLHDRVAKTVVVNWKPQASSADGGASVSG